MVGEAFSRSLWCVVNSQCSFEDCTKPARTKGLCSGHYGQLWRGESLRVLRVHRGKYLPDEICIVEGCSDKPVSRELCTHHYGQLKRGVKPGTIFLNRKNKINWGDPESEKVARAGAHLRCDRLWGRVSKYLCIECGKPAKDWAYDGTDPTEIYDDTRTGGYAPYSLYPEFYMPMCRSCHLRRDRGIARVELTEYRKSKLASPEILVGSSHG